MPGGCPIAVAAMEPLYEKRPLFRDVNESFCKLGPQYARDSPSLHGTCHFCPRLAVYNPRRAKSKCQCTLQLEICSPSRTNPLEPRHWRHWHWPTLKWPTVATRSKLPPPLPVVLQWCLLADVQESPASGLGLPAGATRGAAWPAARGGGARHWRPADSSPREPCPSDELRGSAAAVPGGPGLAIPTWQCATAGGA